MQYDHITQHTLENLARIERSLTTQPLTPRNALFLCDILTSYAHPAAARIGEHIQGATNHSGARAVAGRYLAAIAAIRCFHRLEDTPPDERALFLRREGYVFLRKPETRTLVVVWTTMFNNFYVSNAAMAAMLLRMDCSVLVLRDTSRFNFLKGVTGLADGLPGLVEAVAALAHDEGFDRLVHAGFSSSTYAALYAALTGPCHGYLGLSQICDLSAGSRLPPTDLFDAEVRGHLDPAALIDLAPLLARADPATRRLIFHGARDERDSLHGRHIAGLATAQVTEIAGCSHNTVLHHLSEGSFAGLFERLISG